MSEPTASLLILGLGNPLFGDDGVGVAAVARLQARFAAPEGVTILDGGTLGLALVPILESAERCILVDAIATGEPPGTLVRLTGDRIPSALPPHRLSPHEIGVVDLLFGARVTGTMPRETVLLGLVPGELEYTLKRSPGVEARLDDLVGHVVEEAARFGFHLRPRGRHEEPPFLAWSADPLGGSDGL